MLGAEPDKLKLIRGVEVFSFFPGKVNRSPGRSGATDMVGYAGHASQKGLRLAQTSARDGGQTRGLAQARLVTSLS